MILSVTNSNTTKSNKSQANDAPPLTVLSSSLISSSSSSSEKSFTSSSNKTANFSLSSDSGLVSTSLPANNVIQRTTNTTSSHSSPIKNILCNNENNFKEKTLSSSSSSGASCASDSSAGADLSILSFSSTSSLTSSLDNEFALYPKKSTPKSSITATSSSSSSSSDKLSYLSPFLLAPYFMKPFYGKEWFYDKLVDYLNSKTCTNSSNRCLILLGDIGTGKSHLACELKWPTFNAHLASLKYLSKQIVNVYFLNRHLNHSRFCHRENLEQFYLHLSRSLLTDFSFDSALSSSRPVNSTKRDESDEEFLNRICMQFIHQVLGPLKQKKCLKLRIKEEEEEDDDEDEEKNYFILIDGVENEDELEEECINKKLSSSQLILMFLNKTFIHFPPWLHLIFMSKRCVEKKVLSKYLSNIKYEKLSMDKCVNANAILNTNKINKSNSNHLNISDTTPNITNHALPPLSQSSHSLAQNQKRFSTPLIIENIYSAANAANLKDIQTYILNRLDNDSLLKSKFKKQTNSIDVLNLLLVKSNFCLLYVEKIFDLILNNTISHNDIAEIASGLHGLYEYLIKNLLKSNVMEQDLFYSVLGMALVSCKSFSKLDLFKRLKCRFLKLEFDCFEHVFDCITPVLFKSETKNNKYTIFHASFNLWFTDVKYLDEANFTLTLYYLNKLNEKKDNEEQNLTRKAKHWKQFKYYLKKISSNFLSANEIKYYYMLCEYEYEHKIVLNTLERKLLQCKKLLKMEESGSTDELLFNRKKDIKEENSKYQTQSNKMDYEAIFRQFDLSQVKEDLEKTGNKINEGLLFELLKRSDLPGLKQLLNNDYKLKLKINTLVDAFNQTPLLVACKLNKIELVEFLVKMKPIRLDHCDNGGWTALRYSAWIGNERIVSILLENGASIDVSDLEGRTALRAAVYSGHEQIVKILIKNGADVNKNDLENRSVLHVAVFMGHLKIVNHLLQNRAYVNHQDLIGRNILATSIFMKTPNLINQLEIVRLLIKYGARLDQTDINNQTPLILATKENNLKIAEILVKNGADVDAIDNDSYTALTYSIQNDYPDMFEFLLKNNAATHVLDKQGRSVLSIACSLGSEKIVSLLMDKSLDEMHRDNYGLTPLHEATHSGHFKIVEMLLDYGSEIDACDNEGKSSLLYACQEGNYDIVKMLLQRNADPNMKSHEGITPFRVACLSNHKRICQYLMGESVDIDYKDLDGRTTLHCLVMLNKNIDIIKFLLDTGASLNIKDSEGRTPFHLAISLGQTDVVNLMLNYQKSLQTKIVDSNDNTILISACIHSKLDIIKLILEKASININHENKQGMSALSIRSQNGDLEIVKLLLKHGAHIYASSSNPIKLANRGGFNEIVALLQEWSILFYNNSKTNSNEEGITVSKSIDSINNSQNSINSRSLSQYYFANRSSGIYENTHPFMVHLNDSCETIGGSSPKLSRFKIVRDKILRKSAFIERSSGEFSTPTSKTMNSFKNFLSSLHGQKHLPSKDYESSDTILNTSNSSKVKSNSSLFNLLRRKFSFLNKTSSSTQMNTSTSSYRHSQYEIEKKNKEQIPRSKTDSKGLFNLANFISNNSTRANTLTNINDDETDDVAYILNRNTLKDSLNPKRSFKDFDNFKVFKLNNGSFNNEDVKETINEEMNDPNCLMLNNFKKETSI